MTKGDLNNHNQKKYVMVPPLIKVFVFAAMPVKRNLFQIKTNKISAPKQTPFCWIRKQLCCYHIYF